MTTTMTEFEERVAKGAALLDDSQPGWADRIDLETFDILDPCGCTLGQLFSWYSAGCAYFGFSHDDEADRTQDAAHEFGFFENAHEGEETTSTERYERWRALDAAWMNLIHDRKAAA